MRIFWAFCIYNEIELLPYKIDYMNRNEIDYYIFDNMSNDRSWEWLQDNKIPSERFDSKDMFHHSINSELLLSKIYDEKADWCINTECDVFYIHKDKNLRQVIEDADKYGFNSIVPNIVSFEFLFTGEEKPGSDPRLTYMYYFISRRKDIKFAKYFDIIGIRADSIDISSRKRCFPEDLVMLHYSIRHDAKDRKAEQFQRMKKAWDNGTTKRKYGRNYEKIVTGKRPVIYDKNNYLDIRNSDYWEAIQRSIANG